MLGLQNIHPQGWLRFSHSLGIMSLMLALSLGSDGLCRTWGQPLSPLDIFYWTLHAALHSDMPKHSACLSWPPGILEVFRKLESLFSLSTSCWAYNSSNSGSSGKLSSNSPLQWYYRIHWPYYVGFLTPLGQVSSEPRCYIPAHSSPAQPRTQQMHSNSCCCLETVL